MSASEYQAFISRKAQLGSAGGFSVDPPSFLFDFQRELVAWSTHRGRAAIFADCGMGKTPMQLAWADAVVKHTNKPVLVIAPLSASAQTVREAEKFSIDAERSRDGKFRSDFSRIVITNYERLHFFSPHDFAGVVCDESSILKNFDGATRNAVNEFMRQVPYRLLCTATAAPNDYIELGTSSEALGELGHIDMLSRYFKNDENASAVGAMTRAVAWRFKPHAESHFWRWLCSWSRALRKPSDIGFNTTGFELPPLVVNVTTVAASRPLSGRLFAVPAATLWEQREERRATITQRCEAVADLAASDASPFLAWCHLNDEGDLLERMIPDAVQVAGSDHDDFKEEAFEGFSNGDIRCIVTKPRIAGFGLNWQQCHRMSVFPSHSYEQYYQSVRRCWRYGQEHPVSVDVITTEGEADVLGNLQRKADAADAMFAAMVKEMQYAMGVPRAPYAATPVTMPAWLDSLEKENV